MKRVRAFGVGLRLAIIVFGVFCGAQAKADPAGAPASTIEAGNMKAAAGGDAATSKLADSKAASPDSSQQAELSAGGCAKKDAQCHLKNDFHCKDDDVLCIDSCNGNILDTHDNKPSYADVGTILTVVVVGLCNDPGAAFTSSVTNRPNLSSLVKTVAPPPPSPLLQQARMAFDGSATQVFASTVTLSGQSTDHIADVIVVRTPPTPAPAPVIGQPPVVWTVAHAVYVLRHGSYYIDFGVGAAVVRKGAQTVGASPYRGNADDLRLSTDVSTPTTALFSAFLYPGGHRKDSLSPWGDGSWWRDLIVIQVATELSRANFLRSVYAGVGVEPVSGVNFVIGEAFVPETVYRAGAQAGMAIQSNADVAGVTRNVQVFRPYVAISISTEVFNSAKSAYALVGN
jgi:hypothetical protein